MTSRHVADTGARVSGTRFLAIEDGDEVVAALRAAIGTADGWVHAVGHLEAVEVRVAGDGTDPRRALKGRWTLCSLAGPAAGPYGVVLARVGGLGTDVAGGLLISARALGVTASFAPLAAVAVRAPGPALADAAQPPDAPPTPRRAVRASVAPVVGASAWAEAAASAAELATEPEPEVEEEPELRRGDRVQHSAFGLCDVLGVEGDRIRIRDVHGSGRVREIALDIFDLKRLADRDGKRVFKLARRGE